MRLFITVESARSGERRDAIVSYSPESTVGDLGNHLAELLDEPVSAGTNVVSIDPARRRAQGALSSLSSRATVPPSFLSWTAPSGSPTALAFEASPSVHAGGFKTAQCQKPITVGASGSNMVTA